MFDIKLVCTGIVGWEKEKASGVTDSQGNKTPGVGKMEREECDRRGSQQRSESESLSSCKTAVLAWHIELFNGPANAAGMKTISALQTFYLKLPLPFLLLSLYPILLPALGPLWAWSGNGMVFISQLQPLKLAAFLKHSSFLLFFLSEVSFHSAWYHLPRFFLSPNFTKYQGSTNDSSLYVMNSALPSIF